MARSDPSPAICATLSRPRISLLGEVDEKMVETLLSLLRELEDDEGDLAVEVTTLGGDAEMARRIVLEIEELRARRRSRILFLGKTVVYSAGVTIMSAFPRGDRFLTDDAMVMIHCRQLERTLELGGPMRASLAQVESLKHQIETGLAIEEDGFRRLIEGSDIGLEELTKCALHNWYIPAAEALRRGLVSGVVDAKALARAD